MTNDRPRQEDTSMLLYAAILAVAAFLLGLGDLILDAAGTGLAALFLLFAYLTRFARSEP